MADETRACTRCERELPLEAFAKDARLKAGVRAVCKSCDRAATARRRRGDNPRPGALVLVPKFPEPPADERREVDGPAPAATVSAVVGAYADAAEAFIDALVPPAGDADALLVRSLRGLAELADLAQYGPDRVKDVNTIVASMLRVQRELAATRASKAQAAPAAEPAKPRAASY